jgi:hypothetical protein
MPHLTFTMIVSRPEKLATRGLVEIWWKSLNHAAVAMQQLRKPAALGVAQSSFLKRP